MGLGTTYHESWWWMAGVEVSRLSNAELGLKIPDSITDDGTTSQAESKTESKRRESKKIASLPMLLSEGGDGGKKTGSLTTNKDKRCAFWSDLFFMSLKLTLVNWA